jgi:hypothetical protein
MLTVRSRFLPVARWISPPKVMTPTNAKAPAVYRRPVVDDDDEADAN